MPPPQPRPLDTPTAAVVRAVLLRVPAGFPSPAQDSFDDGRINFNDVLIRDVTSTFILRVAGDSMEGVGIYDGDEVLVDRSLTARDGDVVTAVLDGDFTIKTLRVLPDRVVLHPENPAYPDVRGAVPVGAHGVGCGGPLHPPPTVRVWAVVIALVDVNNFYASCEVLFEPSLAGKPLVVLSNGDGCVVARSAQAKALGITMGAPWFTLAADAPRWGLIKRSSNYQLYADLSERVMLLLARHSRGQEVYSIDECFLVPPHGSPQELLRWGRRLKATVARNVGLPVSIGIAPTKTLAKLATKTAKKIPETCGVVHWDHTPPGYWEELMGALPVTQVWGGSVGGSGRSYSGGGSPRLRTYRRRTR